MRSKWSVVAAGLLAMGLAGATAACGDDDDDDGGGEAGADVNVTLGEWEVVPDPDTVDAGPITFVAQNRGPEELHELIIVKTDLAPGDLPTRDDGAVDEDGEGIEVIGEVDEFEVAGEQTATFDLEAGSYVLLCNVYQEEDQVSHYRQGMRIAFTVN